MNILTVKNLTKQYSEKVLFNNISFPINEGNKIGLLGTNGCGKSTLLKIITGNEPADSGEIFITKNKKIAYLSQNPDFDSDLTVLNQIFQSDSKLMNTIRDYESTVDHLEKDPTSKKYQDLLIKLNNKMDRLNAWEAESQVKTILTKLGINFFDAKMGNLSGGQRKRVFLAAALLSESDLLILDEPTNHMDNKMISWLEEYLKDSKLSLLMVTHDRYFLDRVVNQIIEIDNQNLYTYEGNYSKFLDEKSKRAEIENKIARKKQQLYKTELKWIRAGVQARSTKQKARIDRFNSLKKDVKNQDTESSDLTIPVGFSRLGKKVINITNLSKSYGDLVLLKDFEYIFSNGDRIGIIGKNGVGKSSLLKIITENIKPDSGKVDIGSTVKIGYFSQDYEHVDENLRAIEFIKETAEFITTDDGSKISASQMMENFLFPSELQWSFIKKLSGGEKRRLFLLQTLMLAPNVLILDEPTNDLDINTLNVLENYLDNFKGTVITVSHDRYFLDRTCDIILNFEGKGKINKYVGNYTDYLAMKESEESITIDKVKKEKKSTSNKKNVSKKLKFTYHEKKEFAVIEEEIETLENELEEIESEIEKQVSDFVKLNELMKEKESIEDKLLFKMERFEYLTDLNDKINNQNKMKF